MSPGLLFNTQDVFKDDSMSNVIKATWAAIATGIGSGQAQLQLKSGSINMCQLGDLIVFLLAEVPILAGGSFFANGHVLAAELCHGAASPTATHCAPAASG